VLRVKAASSDGVWNEAGIALPLRVAPAPWETWWAYLGYVVTAMLIAAALYLGHRLKIRREEEYSRRLEIEVRQRTEKLIETNNRLHEANRALQESSLSDPLTGLRNRRFVLEEVSRDLEVIRRRLDDEAGGIDPRNVAALTFMMIDLDHFKPINDTYGHAAGDRMLLEVRDVLLKTCRRSDFVIRWGGDEFVVIAKQAKPGESEALAERIRRDIANHQFKVGDGQVVRTTCSIGFAAYPLFKSRADDTSLDQIINLADNLMYEAKKQRNAWAGMLGPSTAATSANIDIDSVEPTSVLFRAHGASAAKRRSDEPAESTKAAVREGATPLRAVITAEDVASILQQKVG
jgi:diguanylate cyclase (GGDEF)-like protein